MNREGLIDEVLMLLPVLERRLEEARTFSKDLILLVEGFGAVTESAG